MPESSESPLLDVRRLQVTFPGPTGDVVAVRQVSFSLGRERLGIVGESGSGKSTTGRAILRLIAPPGQVRADGIRLNGQDLMALSETEMREVRGKRISMVMQDPKYSLNPVMKVGHQIEEAYRVHGAASRSEARARSLAMLKSVRIREPEKVYHLYPHQVSGGMGQRIMIAMMLIPEPDLLIADEPTSALDVTVRLQILAILDDLVRERGLGLIFISHDLNLVASFCDRVLIMYAGQVVETCQAAELKQARHPYTRGLLASLPRVGERRDELPTLRRDPAWAEPLSDGSA